jgi:A/G-specific adenine glycosylase
VSRGPADPPDPPRVRRALLRWFARHGRRFFWREAFAESAPPLTDFQVLLTEFLLWKTAARAEPTIEAIVRRLPSPGHALRLSRERLEADLRPLGLHRRRAACLLAFSRQIVERHGGIVPRSVAELRLLTGIGQYAARATACVLAGSRLMPVDANTIRVFGRLYGEEGPGPREPGAAWDARFDAFVPRREPRRFLWAVMDLSALICLPREPRCSECPLHRECVTGKWRAARVPAP